jgi:PAS domain-containing protein
MRQPGSCEASFDTWLHTIDPRDREQTWPPCRAAADSGSELMAEWRVNNPGGPARWLMSRGQPQRDDSGASRATLGVVMDITERKQIEDALRESEETVPPAGPKTPRTPSSCRHRANSPT